MTWITSQPTKKAFKAAALTSPETLQVVDPSIIGGFVGTLEQAMLTRREIVITNHPKRSWFARVGRRADGKLAVE